MLGIEELMSKGERVTSNDYRRICREIEEFMLDNALPSYFLGVWQDYGTGRETPCEPNGETSSLELC